MEELSPLFAIQAEKLLEEGKVPEAINLCRQGIEEYPGYASAFGTLAKAYKLIGKQGQLDNTIRGAMERFPLVRTVKNIKINIETLEPLPERDEAVGEVMVEEVMVEEAEVEEAEILAESPGSLEEKPIGSGEDEKTYTEEIATEDRSEEIPVHEDEIETVEEVIESAAERTIGNLLGQSESDEPMEIKSTGLGLIPGLDFAMGEPGLKPVLEVSDEIRTNGQDSPELQADSQAETTEEVDSEQGSDAGDFDGELLAAMKNDSGLSEMAEKISELSGEPANNSSGDKAGSDEINESPAEPNLTSETLAGILEDQGAYKDALEAYEILLESKPERAEFYRQKITELKSKPGMK